MTYLVQAGVVLYTDHTVVRYRTNLTVKDSMQKTINIQKKHNQKDYLKGQKIVGALYLVTNHLSDTDPIKHGIRTKALAILEGVDLDQVTISLTNLLNAAVFAGIVSEKNASIIILELRLYHTQGCEYQEQSIGELFTQTHNPMPIRTEKRHVPTMSFMSDALSLKSPVVEKTKETKNNRQQQIVSFINERKSAGIKDIALLFPDVSEKTIQRELGFLVDTAQITKRGSKRWSVYMAI